MPQPSRQLDQTIEPGAHRQLGNTPVESASSVPSIHSLPTERWDSLRLGLSHGLRPKPTSGSIGPYRVAFDLASGGMAKVYLAVTTGAAGFRKVVALKRIHRHYARDPSFTEMFIDEARIAARITHANVCQVFDFDEDEHGHYIAMEYLAGESLARIMKGLRANREVFLSARHAFLAAHIVAGVAEGLHAVHTLTDENGEKMDVVHRDVTPENLFVLYDGAVKLTDFGIAHARNRMHKTEAHTVKGKLQYLAPEQLFDGQVTPQSDLWSLGVVLWELLVGRSLFACDTQGETVMAVCARPIPPPSSLRSQVSPELDRIVCKALARDLPERYASARELSDDLQRFLAREGGGVPVRELQSWMTELFPFGAEMHRELARAACERASQDAPSDSSELVQELDDFEVVDDFARSSDTTPVLVRPSAAPHARLHEQARPGLGPSIQSAVPLMKRSLQRLTSSGPQRHRAFRRVAAALLVGVVSLSAGAVAAWQVLQPRGTAQELRAPEPKAKTTVHTLRPAQHAAAREQPAPPEPSEAFALAPRPEPAPGPSATQPVATARSARWMPAVPRRDAPKAQPSAPVHSTLKPTGSIHASTTGVAALVAVDGRELGRTPLHTTLPAGQHRLEFRPIDGGAPRFMSIEVTPGATSIIAIPTKKPELAPSPF